jgi:hypothetical protein
MNLRHLFIAAFAVGLIISCQKEIEHPTVGSSVKCVNCTYLPFCDSSVLVYVNTTANGVDTVTSIPRILGDTTVNNQQFTKISAVSFFNQGLLYNCAAEEYKVWFNLASLGLNLDSIKNVLLQQLPIPIPPNLIQIPATFQTTILKAGASTGQSWIDTIFNISQPPLFSAFAGIKYTLAEKSVQRTVLGKAYNNVIHVKGEVVLNSPLGNLPLGFTIDYYFAKDVGFIEIEVRNATQMQLNSKLYSYKLR